MGGDAEMDVLVETLWSLQVPGSVTALGRLALRCWREGRAAAVQTYCSSGVSHSVGWLEMGPHD